MKNFDISSKFNAKLKSKVDSIRIQKATEKTRFIENYEMLKSFVTQSLDKGIIGQTRGKEIIYEKTGKIEYIYNFGNDIAGFMSVAKVISSISTFYLSNEINNRISKEYGIFKVIDCKDLVNGEHDEDDSITIYSRLVNDGENPNMFEVKFYLENKTRGLILSIEKCTTSKNTFQTQNDSSTPRKVKIIKRHVPDSNRTTTVREVWSRPCTEEEIDFTDEALAVISAIFG
jgi:hypothetical protein